MLAQTCDSNQCLLYTISPLYTLLNEQILLLSEIKSLFFHGVSGVEPSMNGKPWEGEVPALWCWMCSLSWGIQFRLLLLDAVRSNDVFLMLFSTCSVPLKITKQDSHCKDSLETWTELSISWLLVLILLSIDVKMSQFIAKCKYFPKRVPKTIFNAAHW